MLTLPVLIFATKNRWKWAKTKDSTTFLRREIAKATFANKQKLTLKSTSKYLVTSAKGFL